MDSATKTWNEQINQLISAIFLGNIHEKCSKNSILLNLKTEKGLRTSSNWRKRKRKHIHKWIKSNRWDTMCKVLWTGEMCMCDWAKEKERRTHTPKNDVLKKHFFFRLRSHLEYVKHLYRGSRFYIILLRRLDGFFFLLLLLLLNPKTPIQSNTYEMSWKFPFERLYSSSFDI